MKALKSSVNFFNRLGDWAQPQDERSKRLRNMTADALIVLAAIALFYELLT